MNWLKGNRLFGVVLLGLGVLAAAEGWLWFRSREQALTSLAALEQKKHERDWLVGQSPALSEANEQAIVRDLAHTRKVIGALRAALAGREGGVMASPPEKSIDLFFDLAGFVEKTRALAARVQVATKPGESFGFAAHTHEGPEAGLVPAVFRQRVVAQYLVEALIEARPQSLLAVQRERPLTAAQRTERNQPSPTGAPPFTAPVGRGGQAEDFLEFDPALSVRRPGQVDSDAFRLEFTGQTAALRTFLNTLATFRLPVIVRSVEVEPLATGAAPVGPGAASPPAGAPVPLVAQNSSRFAVTVEYVLPEPDPVMSTP
ncbi:MAG: Amuc_1100 family pilus-like protein [Lacunisphaera sp.]|nr:Amuc_1100 family pilus-like protein [Lacunisphaera sp.]